MANLGTLAESVKKFPMTDLWMDSCGEEELDYGILRGIVGATSNPIIVGNVVKNEMDKWEPEIKKLIQDMPEATEDEIRTIEKVTGFKYDNLWNREHALKFKS